MHLGRQRESTRKVIHTGRTDVESGVSDNGLSTHSRALERARWGRLTDARFSGEYPLASANPGRAPGEHRARYRGDAGKRRRRGQVMSTASTRFNMC